MKETTQRLYNTVDAAHPIKVQGANSTNANSRSESPDLFQMHGHNGLSPNKRYSEQGRSQESSIEKTPLTKSDVVIPSNQIDINAKAQADLSELVQKMRANLPSSHQNLAAQAHTINASGSPTMSSHSISSAREMLDRKKT